MADPIDALENLLEQVVENSGGTEMLPLLYRTIDKWRHTWGGSKAYIAKRSHQRKYSEIIDMVEKGMTPAQIAPKVGLSQSQVRRVKAKTSTYI